MIVYHEASPGTVEAVLRDGLKRTSRGEKGNDPSIVRTDVFLDARRPKPLQTAGVSRVNNLYAFMVQDGRIISITDGHPIPVGDFVTGSGQAVFQLEVDPALCYVSDLDRYDAFREALDNRTANNETLQQLAAKYWQCVAPLAHYTAGSIRRPEIMVTYDVPREAIELISTPTD